MEQRERVIDVFDFPAPMFVFVNLVNIQILSTAGEELPGSIQQGMGTELNVIGHDIERLILMPAHFDVLEDEG